MRTRYIHRWVLWLLPLFAVRALIPAGFMLAPEQGSLQLVLCPAQGAVLAPQVGQGAVAHHEHGTDAAAGASAHDHASSQHAEHSSGSGLHDNAICPFALAGMVALTAAGATASLDLERVTTSLPTQADRLPFEWPGGIDRIRGPPAV